MNEDYVLDFVWHERHRLWLRWKEVEVLDAHLSHIDRRAAKKQRRQALREWCQADKRYEQVLAAYCVIAEVRRAVGG